MLHAPVSFFADLSAFCAISNNPNSINMSFLSRITLLSHELLYVQQHKRPTRTHSQTDARTLRVSSFVCVLPTIRRQLILPKKGTHNSGVPPLLGQTC